MCRRNAKKPTLHRHHKILTKLWTNTKNVSQFRFGVKEELSIVLHLHSKSTINISKGEADIGIVLDNLARSRQKLGATMSQIQRCCERSTGIVVELRSSIVESAAGVPGLEHDDDLLRHLLRNRVLLRLSKSGCPVDFVWVELQTARHRPWRHLSRLCPQQQFRWFAYNNGDMVLLVVVALLVNDISAVVYVSHFQLHRRNELRFRGQIGF